jgi:hypothetical protein
MACSGKLRSDVSPAQRQRNGHSFRGPSSGPQQRHRRSSSILDWIPIGTESSLTRWFCCPGKKKNIGTGRPRNHTLNCFCWLPPARHGASCSALHATGSNFGTSCGWHAHPPLHRTLAPSLRKAANVQCCSRKVLNPDDAFAFEPCVVENAWPNHNPTVSLDLRVPQKPRLGPAHRDRDRMRCNVQLRGIITRGSRDQHIAASNGCHKPILPSYRHITCQK